MTTLLSIRGLVTRLSLSTTAGSNTAKRHTIPRHTTALLQHLPVWWSLQQVAVDQAAQCAVSGEMQHICWCVYVAASAAAKPQLLMCRTAAADSAGSLSLLLLLLLREVSWPTGLGMSLKAVICWAAKTAAGSSLYATCCFHTQGGQPSMTNVQGGTWQPLQ